MSTLVLKYAGPPLWGSYNEIWPVLGQVWDELELETVSLWFPQTISDSKILTKILKAKTLIFPLGIYHIDALKSLESFRSLGFTGRAIIMCAGAGMQGAAYFRHRQAALRSNDMLIVNSPKEKDLLESQLGKKVPIVSIPLPVDQAIFYPKLQKKKNRKELNLDFRAKYLIYAGRISVQKNLLSAITVFSELRKTDPSWKFLVLGLPDDVGIPHMENQNKLRYVHELGFWIQKLNLSEYVEFRGQASQVELARYLNAADASINLTLHHSEDFGYSVAQAACCGLPTIVSNWGGGAFFVDQGLCQGVTVFATPNGPRIAFNQALTEVQKLKKMRLEKLKILSIKEVAKSWKKVLRNKGESSTAVKFNFPAIWKDVKLPYKTGHPAFMRHALIYGAIKPIGKKWYQHPQYLSSEEHLFDPISFVREISSPSKKDFKKLGILLPLV